MYRKQLKDVRKEHENEYTLGLYEESMTAGLSGHEILSAGR